MEILVTWLRLYDKDPVVAKRELVAAYERRSQVERRGLALLFRKAADGLNALASTLDEIPDAE